MLAWIASSIYLLSDWSKICQCFVQDCLETLQNGIEPGSSYTYFKRYHTPILRVWLGNSCAVRVWSADFGNCRNRFGIGENLFLDTLIPNFISLTTSSCRYLVQENLGQFGHIRNRFSTLEKIFLDVLLVVLSTSWYIGVSWSKNGDTYFLMVSDTIPCLASFGVLLMHL